MKTTTQQIAAYCSKRMAKIEKQGYKITNLESNYKFQAVKNV